MVKGKRRRDRLKKRQTEEETILKSGHASNGLQGSKLTEASSKYATSKSHLLPLKNVGSKKSLPGNSVLKVVSWKNKPIFLEIILIFIRQNTIPYGIINAFDHMEFCLVINLTMCGNLAVTWLPMIATRHVSFATTLNIR